MGVLSLHMENALDTEGMGDRSPGRTDTGKHHGQVLQGDQRLWPASFLDFAILLLWFWF